MLKFMPETWMTVLISLAILALLGCNAKPFDYQPTAGEMKQGEGLLTGEDGELTIYDSKKGGAFPKDSDTQEAEVSGEKTAPTTAAAGTAAAGSQGHRVNPLNSRNSRNISSGKKKKNSSTNTSSGRNPQPDQLITKNSRSISNGRNPPGAHRISRISRSTNSGKNPARVRLIT